MDSTGPQGHPATTSVSRLLELPSELRLEIYEYVFAGEQLIYEAHAYDAIHERNLYHRTQSPLIHTPPSAALLQTCKFILNDAIECFSRSIEYVFVGEARLDLFCRMFPSAPEERIMHLSGVDVDDPHLIGHLHRFKRLKSLNVSLGQQSEFMGRPAPVIDSSTEDLDLFSLITWRHGDTFKILENYTNAMGRVHVTINFEVEARTREANRRTSLTIPCVADLTSGTITQRNRIGPQFGYHRIEWESHGLHNCNNFYRIPFKTTENKWWTNWWEWVRAETHVGATAESVGLRKVCCPHIAAVTPATYVDPQRFITDIVELLRIV